MSIVQYLAVQTLMELDRREKTDADTYAFKLAAMSGDPNFVSSSAESLFPEWFDTSIMDDPELGDIPSGSITYITGEEEMTGADMEAIIAQMRGQ